MQYLMIGGFAYYFGKMMVEKMHEEKAKVPNTYRVASIPHALEGARNSSVVSVTPLPESAHSYSLKTGNVVNDHNTVQKYSITLDNGVTFQSYHRPEIGKPVLNV